MSPPSSVRALAALLLACLFGSGCDDAPSAVAFDVLRSWKLPENVDQIDLSPDGRAAIASSALGSSTLLHDPWQSPINLRPESGGVLDARFIGADRLLLVSRDGVVELFQAADGARLAREKIELPKSSRHALVAPDGRYIAFDARVYDRQAARWVVEGQLPAHQTGMAFAVGRSFLSAGYHDHKIDLYPLAEQKAHSWRTKGKAAAAAISADGAYVAGSSDGDVLLWNAESGAAVCTADVGGDINLLGFGAGWLAAVGSKLHLLKIPGCEEIATLRILERPTKLDIDGSLIAIGDITGAIHVWDAQVSRLVARGRALGRQVRALRVNAGRRQVFVAGDADNGAELKLLQLR